MKSVCSLFILAALLCAANLFAQTNAPVQANVAPVVKYAPGSALIPATRATPTNWLSRHEGFVAQAKKGGVDILFMGDSITDNWRSKGVNIWNKYYAPQHAANFGIGGDRTQHVLWRIENGELEGIKPKAAVIMIGTNNSGDDSPDDIAKAVKMIIDDTHAKIPETKILLLAIFPRGPRTNSVAVVNDIAKRMEVIRATNERISKYDDGKTVKYLDIGGKFLDADGKIPRDVMADQLHPTEKGYQIWADAMNPTLDEMMK
ncbi:MAG TPA: platelet-activating factor acetylhydrolase IB subunit [Verrucomicrobiae bacterium]|nr:platelet-activating factor acetylhydrolase IB subunit [Verrucomicrobiae bacterium]